MVAIGVGVIGCGDIARIRYFPSIEALPQLKLAGVYSRTPAQCNDIVRRYGGKAHNALDSFLHDDDIEAVIITTPHPSHADLTIRALQAGKHVLTEKPMATSLVDASRVRKAADRSPNVFMALPYDDSAPMKEAKRLIQNGAIGRVSSADAVMAHQGPLHASWFFSRDMAEWGVLADLGIYIISQLTSSRSREICLRAGRHGIPGANPPERSIVHGECRRQCGGRHRMARQCDGNDPIELVFSRRQETLYLGDENIWIHRSPFHQHVIC